MQPLSLSVWFFLYIEDQWPIEHIMDKMMIDVYILCKSLVNK